MPDWYERYAPTMAGTDSILSVRDLRKTYKKGIFKRERFEALRGIDLEVGRGSVFGLLGPNGAGKTTLIKVLLGLLPSWQGHAEVFGMAPQDPNSRRRIGYLPESHRMPEYLTGWQVMILFGMMTGRSRAEIEERAPALMQRLGIWKDAHRKVRGYSKGMQQRLGLAQSLIHNPDLLFLDEPTDGVDPRGRKAIRHLIEELKADGMTIFINSHLLQEVEMICDRVVIMHQGEILRQGTIAELAGDDERVRILLDKPDAEAQAGLQAFGHAHTEEPNGTSAIMDDDQANAAIDYLRARGTRIREVRRDRKTLEDVFIELIEEDRK